MCESLCNTDFSLYDPESREAVSGPPPLSEPRPLSEPGYPLGPLGSGCVAPPEEKL